MIVSADCVASEMQLRLCRWLWRRRRRIQLSQTDPIRLISKSSPSSTARLYANDMDVARPNRIRNEDKSAHVSGGHCGCAD